MKEDEFKQIKVLLTDVDWSKYMTVQEMSRLKVSTTVKDFDDYFLWAHKEGKYGTELTYIHKDSIITEQRKKVYKEEGYIIFG